MTLSKISRLYLPLEIEKNHLNRLISDSFQAVAITKQDKVTGLQLSGIDKRLTLELTLEGRYNGLVWAEFTPQIDNESKTFKLQDLQIRMEENGFLIKGLNWLLHSALKGKIEELVQSHVNKSINKMVEAYINNGQVIPLPHTLNAQLMVQEVNLHDFSFKEDILYADIEAYGTLKLLSSPVLPLASAKKK